MKTSDQYHKWVEWSEEDQTYLGKCPDLITGIHGDDPVQVYAELCDVAEEVVRHFESTGRPLPLCRVRPMLELVQQRDIEQLRGETIPYEDVRRELLGEAT